MESSGLTPRVDAFYRTEIKMSTPLPSRPGSDYGRSLPAIFHYFNMGPGAGAPKGHEVAVSIGAFKSIRIPLAKPVYNEGGWSRCSSEIVFFLSAQRLQTISLE